ncbi:dipeptidase [Bizionia myxarmorum]|uniref:Membrane dipeptidase n=1 Tax=Bizionia myxarmorum TaxID=291186 RepID=A0A5D0R5K9_9FLAO|nr:dipeptidase [Bizionia myxarmorum]TYB76329.1 membrane dipeptidase [Bizionia myxarmorum]
MKSIYVTSVLVLMLFSCENGTKKTEIINPEKELVVVTPEMIERAKGIHERVITLDTHDDFDINNFTDSINYTQNLKSQVTLPKMKEGGLDVAWFIVYTGQDTLTTEGYNKAHETAMGKFNAIHRLVTDIAPEEIELAVNSDDVRRIYASGKKIAMIGIENGYPIGMDVKNVGKFYNLGGRYMSLSHNGHSQLSDSNTGEKDSIWLHNGLSPLGKEVIVEMNRLGMMVDVSHPSKEAMRQMIELSKAPIIASHSSARALCDHSRNLDDEQLQWMKDNGGVVQAVAFDAYLNTEKVEARQEALKGIQQQVADSMGVKWYNSREEVMALSKDEREAFYGYYGDVNRAANDKAKAIADFPPAVNVSDFVDHIDYMVGKIGIEHVGISSDFDGGGGIEGWADASETFNVTLELVRRGYTEAEISKLWSENLLRVLDKVQAIALDMQKTES